MRKLFLAALSMVAAGLFAQSLTINPFINFGAGGGGGGGFTDPSDWGDKLNGWYGSTDGATNDDAALQQWDDASNLGRDIKDESSNYPTYRTGEQNGHDVVEFDNSSGMMVGQGALAGTVLPQPTTFFAVVRVFEDNGTGMICSDTNTSIVSFFWHGTSKNWRLEAATRLEDGTDFATNQWYIVTGHLEGGSSVIRTNGVQALTGDAGANLFHGLRVGGDNNAGVFLFGQIGELVIATNLVEADWQNGETYLGERWGITVPSF